MLPDKIRVEYIESKPNQLVLIRKQNEHGGISNTLKQNPNFPDCILDKNKFFRKCPFTWDEIKEKIYYHDYYIISSEKIITEEIIENNLDRPWHHTSLMWNPNITWPFIQKNMMSKNPINWDFSILSCNPNITPEIISQNPYQRWNIIGLATNHSFSYEEIRDKFSQKRDSFLSFIRSNPSLTYKTYKEIGINTFDYESNKFLWNESFCNKIYKRDLIRKKLINKNLFIRFQNDLLYIIDLYTNAL
jgi:hypothetical protein